MTNYMSDNVLALFEARGGGLFSWDAFTLRLILMGYSSSRVFFCTQTKGRKYMDDLGYCDVTL